MYYKDLVSWRNLFVLMFWRKMAQKWAVRLRPYAGMPRRGVKIDIFEIILKILGKNHLNLNLKPFF
jgi:hypothetical protein